MPFYEDPFVNTTNVVNPLQLVGNVNDQYSIKVSVKHHMNGNPQINVYSGTFVSDLNMRAIGFQGTIMEALEYIIKKALAPDFVLGPLPTLGRPADYIFQPDDILVSFASKNDFLVFNGSGVNREVTFMTIGQLPQNYRPGDFGSPPDFTFISSEDVNYTYKVTYDEYGKFTVLVNGTKLLTFDNFTNPMTPVATYDTTTLEETVLDDDTKFYKTPFYTSIGITVLPNILPGNQQDILLAEGQAGLFYDGEDLDSQIVIDYIYSLYSFTSSQRNYISRLIKSMFPQILRSIYHILYLRNRDIFSSNNGFATFIPFNGVSIEIKLA